MPFEKYRPDEKLSSVCELDLASLSSRGISALIFDLDNTLGIWGFKQMPDETLAHLKSIESHGFQLGFLSNHNGKDREHVINALSEYPLVFAARKPELAGFKKILELLNVNPTQTAMIGDQLFTDVLGAKRLGMYAIMVDPVAPEVEDFEVRIRRFFERVLLSLWKIQEKPS